MTPDRIWLCIESNFANVRIAAGGLRGVLAELGCDDEQLPSIELCVVEAMNNVVEHAYGEKHGKVEIQITGLGHEIEIAISDTGRPMPDGLLERSHLPTPAEEPRDGGYGLGLIRELMAQVRYQRLANVNTLTMTASLTRTFT